MKVIEFKNVTLGYGAKTIINKLSFSVLSGEYIYIVGENGVGKSTLVKGLINLIKPFGGDIILNDIEYHDIGYLPQLSTSMKNFPASVFEVCLSGILNQRGIKPTYTNENKNKVIEVLKELNILNLKNKCFKELSGGQQRRVLLARALVSSTKVLVMDEPITGLDPKAVNDFYKLIDKLNKDKGITVIVVSHDIRAAVKYADKVLHLSDAHYCFGDVESYKKNMLSELFLEGE